MKRSHLVLGALLLCCAAVPARAHEVRPGYLLVQEAGRTRYEILWKVPARGDRRLSLHVRFPAPCRDLVPVSQHFVGGASVERRQLECPAGLRGQSISIEGLSGTLTDVLARVEHGDGSVQVERLSPDQPGFRVKDSPSWTATAAAYLGMGIKHILLGVDHLLFVLALMLLVRGGRRLVETITAFTIAHSLTLGAATLGLIRVPQAPVEAVIALSIVFVASEIIHARQGRPGLTLRRPWIVALTFGLLHGFGFAGALTAIGLPAQAVPLALLFFNLGVEVGQLLFVAACLLLARAAGRLWVRAPGWAGQLPAYGIGTMAAFWLVQRVAGFWS